MERKDKIEFLIDFMEYMGDFKIELVKNYEYGTDSANSYHMYSLIESYVDGNRVEEFCEKELKKPQNTRKLMREFKKELYSRINKYPDRKKNDVHIEVIKEFEAKGLNLQV